MRRRHKSSRPAGAALLLALLSVALVTTLASAAAWRQWRGVETETAHRLAQQRQWWAHGATDWARALLREDLRADLARGSGVDHLGETWSQGLPSTPMADWIGAETGDSQGPVRLHGSLQDAQGKLNLTNLLQDNAQAALDHAAIQRLFVLLDIAPEHLDTLTRRMPRPPAVANAPNAAGRAPTTWPLQRLHHLSWAGLPQEVVDRLAPFVTVLPERTPVNANTAPAEVLAAVWNQPLGTARAWVTQRQRQPWLSAERLPTPPSAGGEGNEASVGVASRYFELRSAIDGPSGSWRETVLLQRNGLDVRVLRRERDWPSQTASGKASLQ